MILRLEHIDAIAQKMQRDVLSVEFQAPHNDKLEVQDELESSPGSSIHWESVQVRKDFIA
jgi:hypothetical protein